MQTTQTQTKKNGQVPGYTALTVHEVSREMVDFAGKAIAYDRNKMFHSSTQNGAVILRDPTPVERTGLFIKKNQFVILSGFMMLIAAVVGASASKR